MYHVAPQLVGNAVVTLLWEAGLAEQSAIVPRVDPRFEAKLACALDERITVIQNLDSLKDEAYVLALLVLCGILPFDIRVIQLLHEPTCPFPDELNLPFQDWPPAIRRGRETQTLVKYLQQPLLRLEQLVGLVDLNVELEAAENAPRIRAHLHHINEEFLSFLDSS